MAELSQAFSKRQLGWMRRWHSQAHLRAEDRSRPGSAKEWSDFLQGIQDQIAEDKFSFRGLRWHKVRGKPALSTSYLEDTLVVRKINDNIRRSYGITQPSRTTLVRTAKQALSENAPKTVIRFDLKGCFESINRDNLLKQLRADAKLTTQTTALLDVLFARAAKKCPGHMPHGIPRGMSISTSLAELKLRGLDRQLRAIPGVYLVLRYVDDILIFSTAAVAETEAAARKVITENSFRVNEEKSRPYRVACKCDLVCAHGVGCPCKSSCKCLSKGSAKLIDLEYLGYKLLFYRHNEKDRRTANEVYCVLSDRKIARVKTRIAKAFKDCLLSSDWTLLEHRIQFLSSNQLVAAEPGRRGLFSGMSYTHGEYVQPDDYPGPGTLRELDSFYRTHLRRTVKSATATPYNLAKLRRLSFDSGFRNHRRTKFDPLRVIAIQKCWEE